MIMSNIKAQSTWPEGFANKLYLATWRTSRRVQCSLVRPDCQNINWTQLPRLLGLATAPLAEWAVTNATESA